MTTHVEGTTAHGHDEAPATGLRFEKSELNDFVADDRYAGEAIGKLLAMVFALSLVLMVSVSYWTSRHQSQGHDPHSVPAAATEEHH